MPLRKFELITRYFRTFDHTNLDVSDERDLPKTFPAAEEWSKHIQRVSIELYLPGTNLTVDECMVPFTGRSKETTLVKGKPTPVGFKIWVIAQQGCFLQWLWHVKASPVVPATIKLKIPKPYGKKGKLQTEIPLSNTQSVVVHLLKRLSTPTHHVFTDNLFSSPRLFRLLRQLGYGATGTAHPNCGITAAMKQIKETGKLPDGKPLLYNKVLQVAWKDSSVVLFLITVHGEAPLNRTPKKRKLPAKRGTKAEAQRLKEVFNGDQSRIIPIPSIAAQYNDEMNHVDRGDQIRSYTSYQHRFRRGPWQALLWSFLLDVALVNSFILQKKTRQPHWKPYSTLRAWKECIYNAIFNKRLRDWILVQADLGCPVSHQQVREFASKIAVRNGFPEGVGKNWLQGFLSRNEDIKTLKGKKIDYERYHGASTELIKPFFMLLMMPAIRIVKQKNRYNVDEVGMMEGIGMNGLFLGHRHKKSVLIRQPGSRAWITILECISATGKVLRPTVIFKGKTVQQQHFPEGLDSLDDWEFACSEKGWTSNKLALI
ncbi:hypothetical protein FOXG_22000 [Fusarium oxysporum f. sp. lycopersici 4287]|uniref:HTH CENPB-type domain-containing protein n=1 Tax=Fusarium oxysporum f. sp. lycopersici (strain 4287 / CBS 123668 / FGSC 9935 / NRRL 34936) TaxID=426428 RepID=A0A0J9W433_FUSO4|nr:hypothetical protein FOXG_22000 [Fusarium oxysporum f. sp. lycopersici 4287]KNB17655.1 hypothetical protein FOXG_22000 [Fusarium oxysporum f. sp. lycopersici 4287]